MYKIAAFFLVAAVYAVHGQVVTLGTCPDVSGQANFSVEDFTGTWYQVKKYPSLPESGSCGAAEYTLSDDGTYVNVVNSQYILSIRNEVTGKATVASDDGSAELSVTLNIYNLFEQTAPLIILETDYETYAVVYSCSQVGLLKGESAWIMSRTRQFSEETSDYIDSYLESSDVLDSNFLLEADQSNCADA